MFARFNPTNLASKTPLSLYKFHYIYIYILSCNLRNPSNIGAYTQQISQAQMYLND